MRRRPAARSFLFCTEKPPLESASDDGPFRLEPRIGVRGADVAGIERRSELRRPERRLHFQSADVDEIHRDVRAAAASSTSRIRVKLLIQDEAGRHDDHRLAAAHRRHRLDRLGERAEGRAVARGRARVGFGRAQSARTVRAARPPRLSSRAVDLRRDCRFT